MTYCEFVNAYLAFGFTFCSEMREADFIQINVNSDARRPALKTLEIQGDQHLRDQMRPALKTLEIQGDQH